jgi:hypothetical protein
VTADDLIAAEVVHALGADPRTRLPDGEDRALRIPKDGHPADVQHVEGVVDHLAAELARARSTHEKAPGR